ncbi:MAG TPA: hypothetical protein VG389_22690 [Myxococcota bacterium]|nr:hypothetical protein [Myxococcota bacterium]
MPEQPPHAAGRRPAELTLQEMEREARRLLRSADLEERRNAARAREVEALRAEVELLKMQQALLTRDLAQRPLDEAALETRIGALAQELERIRKGIEPNEAGSLTARIATRRPHAAALSAPEADDASAEDDGAGTVAAAASGRGIAASAPPVLVRLRFRRHAARPGEAVVLDLDAPGFPDGEEVALELWDRARGARLGEASALVASEAAHVELIVPFAAAAAGGLAVCARARTVDAWSPPLDVSE